MSNLEVTFPALDSLMCMKYCDILERTGARDILDFRLMMRSNNVTISQFIKKKRD